MSYQVLARKWRPRKFSELVGQEHVVTAIANALDNDRLHHAYLFTGTRGVGKTTIARIFSKSLNCEEGQGANPCGVCDTCREIEQGNYVDLLEIDAASRTKVEDTRELLDNVQYKPTRGRYKVYLIDEVHMLSKHSFNALLKTLEEPPPHVKFLLATTDPQKLPITILSRCLQFNLKALSREQISGQLTHILQQESIPFEAPALALLARAAQGSMRDALSLTDQAIAQGDNQVAAAIVTDMLGLMDRHQILKLLFALVKKDAPGLLDIVASMAEQAPDFGQVLAELSSLLHQIALTQWVPETCKLETTSAKAIYQLAKALPAEQVQLFYQIALQGRKDLPHAADGRSALEMTLLRMMSFAPVPSGDDNLELIVDAQGSTETPLSQASAQPVPSVASAPETQAAPVHQPAQEKETPEPEAAHAPQPAEHGIVTEGTGTTTGPADTDTSEDLHALNAEQAEIEKAAAEYRQPVISERAPAEPPVVKPDPVKDEPVQRGSSQQLESGQQAEPSVQNGPPQWDDIPPADYDDMPPPVYEDEHYEVPAEHAAPGHQSNNVTQAGSTDSLTSIEEMLALRQQLKTGRKEAAEAPAKKSENQSDTSERVRKLSQRGITSAPPAADNEPAETAASAPSEDDASSPPWESHSVTTAPEADDLADNGQPEVDEAPASQPSFGQEALAQEIEVQADAGVAFVDEEQDHTGNVTPQKDENQAQGYQQTNVPSDSAVAATPTNHVQSVDSDALPAYLPDGSKLLLGRQIDSWSERVAELGLAGLTKQIVLNAAFSIKDQDVTLELDESQSHLINDNAVAQLNEALSKALAHPVNVNIVYGQPAQTPLTLQARIDEMRRAYAHQVVSNDEKFTTLRDLFAATVLEDTVQPR